MAVYISNYEGGIDRDSSKNKYPKGSYYKMKNFRLISFDELSNGAVTSIKGNIPITITGSEIYSTHVVIGQCIIRNYLVVWTTDCHDTTGGLGIIWRTDLSVTSPTWTKVYEHTSMMLTSKYPIYEESIGYYESNTIIKVYWTDNFNMIRYIDIMSSGPSSVDLLNILPNVTLSSPLLKNISSGNILVGKVQYAFQYYNIGGTETVFSPCTPLIHLTQSSEGLTGTNIRLYEGSKSLDDNGNPNNSGKSVTIEIVDADNNYSMVRVVAILYRNIDQLPDIHIVGEYESIDHLIINDYGVYTKGTLTLNAFRTLGNGELYCKTISQKGNKALIANITEKFFDLNFDARAYRNRNDSSVPLIKVFNSKTGIEDTIIQTGGAWPSSAYKIGGVDVPEDHDCINPYNFDFLYPGSPAIDEEATYTSTNDNAYKYQSDLSTVGGEGLNIKYEFVTNPMLFEVSQDCRYSQTDILTIENLTSYDSYKNPMREAYFMNYKHDEVYRHGLVGVNDKGQESFVKWIGDIKTPTIKENPLCIGSAVIAYLSTVYPLGIKFTINTASLVSQGVVAIKIVRVERKKEDRSIYSQGIVSHMFYNNSGSGGDIYNQLIMAYPKALLKVPEEGVDAKFIKQDRVIQFISPEINYFKELSPKANDYIKLVASLQLRPILYGGLTSKYLTTGSLIGLPTHKILEGTLAGIVEWGAHDENKILFATTPGGYSIVNRAIDFNTSTRLPNHEGPSGTCAVLVLNTSLSISVTELLVDADNFELFLVDYKHPGVGASQYGGLTYEARQSNTYIECGPYTPITGGTDDISVYGGDTYINFFEHLKTIWEVDDNDGSTVVDIPYGKRIIKFVTFPCETVINLDVTHGFKYSIYYPNTNAIGIREDAGVWNGDLTDHTMPNDKYDLIQDRGMYEYNSVYSQQNSTKVYFPQPNNWLSVVHDDTLVKISLEKYPREEVDSFLKFLSDNERLLPTQHGQINDLFLFKNYMMVFMDHAFGSLSIDERAILPIQNNSILELGAGNNLQFFDFISNSSGSIHPSSINKIGNGFGWYDAHLNSFGYYNGETQDIGLIKGISSVIKNYSNLIRDITTIPRNTYYTNQFYGGNFLTFENKKYKESYCAMIVSELAIFSSKDPGIYVILTLAYSPGNYLNAEVVIDGVEYYADITGTSGAGTLTINSINNPGLDTVLFNPGSKHFIYYKDLSKVFSFNSVINSFQHEVTIFPNHLIEYNDDLFELFHNMTVYKENEGNYGEFYGIYRYGEIEYLVNPQQSLVCMFNNYEYAMEAIDSNGLNTVGKTWDSIRIYNDYQYGVGLSIDCFYENVTSKIFKALHGLTLNTQLMLSGSVPAITGLTQTQVLSTIFYLVNIEVNGFRLSLTKGGAPLTITTNGTCYYNLLDAPLILTTPVISGNIRRRMRTWRIKDIRDREISKARMRDTYLRLLFKYKHGDNNRIVMHDLYTYYSIIRESINGGQ